MEDSDELPLKRVELSLSKFNEVAIPHHLDLLRQHKANILKLSSLGQYSRVVVEQTRARRVAGQLRALLGELSALRARVRAAERGNFDAATQRARDATLKAIVDYLETSPLTINRRPEAVVAVVAGSAVSTDSVGIVGHRAPGGDVIEDAPPGDVGEDAPGGDVTGDAPPGDVIAGLTVQLKVDDYEVQLREREAVLAGWTSLQRDVRELHEAWRLMHEAAATHAPVVSRAASLVSEAASDVREGRRQLSLAAKVRVGAAGAGGAALGALLGGPAGLLLGAKAALAAALAGSLLGYCAATTLHAAPSAPPAPSASPGGGPAPTPGGTVKKDQ